MRLPPAEPDTVASRALRGLKVTWLGHSTFLMASPKGVRLLFDPFLTNNPACPPAAKRPGAVDLMLITHGHAEAGSSFAATTR
jgi:L-ascorbate metabolism protein UlaG (beta-lactamase superfamily)